MTRGNQASLVQFLDKVNFEGEVREKMTFSILDHYPEILDKINDQCNESINHYLELADLKLHGMLDRRVLEKLYNNKIIFSLVKRYLEKTQRQLEQMDEIHI